MARSSGSRTSRSNLGGASAGGNLTAGVAKRLSMERQAVPASLLLVYPLVHAVPPPPSGDLLLALRERGMASGAHDVLIQAATAHFAGAASVEDEIAFAANGAVPEGHPATFIYNADADGLRASGEAYATKLAQAGVDATVETLPGSTHGFLNEPESAAGRAGVDRLERWLKRAGDESPARFA
ncbi:alpha/beta hydrolase [Nonomuraea composti]|uniref:alpha/beta hydrolase n=1 Tax=Nonomuraea composti TaxID=2720023 RepID=UPI003204CF8E